MLQGTSDGFFLLMFTVSCLMLCCLWKW
jgi:hypothetical protein